MTKAHVLSILHSFQIAVTVHKMLSTTPGLIGLCVKASTHSHPWTIVMTALSCAIPTLPNSARYITNPRNEMTEWKRMAARMQPTCRTSQTPGHTESDPFLFSVTLCLHTYTKQLIPRICLIQTACSTCVIARVMFCTQTTKLEADHTHTTVHDGGCRYM